ncbi:hypothetical protein GIB67_014192 [Kingdonia uniflora]|uniref:ABC transmembrane type-1 domain-containing protein n=1 Tax=Kingdonia uniflora TaxID=39325 RepID=A0A7J7M1S4_9MAGN|nr:hypothetical protein GIB67_014192 [Kingdonia uniflora]
MKILDIRNNFGCVGQLEHQQVVRSAYFSAISGTKILTTSDDKIRVFGSGGVYYLDMDMNYQTEERPKEYAEMVANDVPGNPTPHIAVWDPKGFDYQIIVVTLALILAWKLAILIIALQPLIIGSFYAKEVLMKSMSMKVLQAQSNSSKLASEAIANHRNIAAFSVEEKIMGLFEVTLEGPKRESQKQS